MPLLEEVKDNLRITWKDEDERLEKIILRGKSFLEGLTGTKLNFEEEGEAKSLLLDYCRYNYNNALEYFEENFERSILRLQFMEAVKDNENQA